MVFKQKFILIHFCLFHDEVDDSNAEKQEECVPSKAGLMTAEHYFNNPDLQGGEN